MGLCTGPQRTGASLRIKHGKSPVAPWRLRDEKRAGRAFSVSAVYLICCSGGRGEGHVWIVLSVLF